MNHLLINDIFVIIWLTVSFYYFLNVKKNKRLKKCLNEQEVESFNFEIYNTFIKGLQNEN